MNTTPTVYPLKKITTNFAWILARRLGKSAPYRGYALDLQNGQFLACNPDGSFEIKVNTQATGGAS